MKSKSLLAGAAVAGLLSGSLISHAQASGNNSSPSVKAGVTLQTLADKDTNGCKGQNTCKGKGGCKSGDNGCKGKNSCKGKGGCATDGSHE